MWPKIAGSRSSICSRTTDKLFNKEAGKQYTINGVAFNEIGDREIANVLYTQLLGTVPNLGGGGVRENPHGRQRQVVGQPARLPHAERLVRLRRPSHIRLRNVPARVRQNSQHGQGPRRVYLEPRRRQADGRQAERRGHRRIDRPADALSPKSGGRKKRNCST
ncbi:MAG: hypothetical protein QM811_11955 [Pirellulales bacterium]